MQCAVDLYLLYMSTRVAEKDSTGRITPTNLHLKQVPESSATNASTTTSSGQLYIYYIVALLIMATLYPQALLLI